MRLKKIKEFNNFQEAYMSRLPAIRLGFTSLEELVGENAYGVT
jgi:hypothetical protein